MALNFPKLNQIDLMSLRRDAFIGKGRVHLDSAGSSLMPTPVISAMQEHMMLEQQVGGYVAAERVTDRIEGVYALLARCFGGSANDYALASSAVDAWTKLFYSIDISASDNIVTSFNEYCSNYVAYLHHARRLGFEIRVARAGEDGKLDLQHLESLIDNKTALISITHVPSSSGQINPVKEVGVIAKRHSVPYLLDICQSVGQVPVNVEEIGCDMATATARKFLRGPRGVGFLYISPEMQDWLNPLVVTNQSAAWTGANQYEMRTDARVFEAWERSVMTQLGFGAALDYFLDYGGDKLCAQTQAVADWLRTELSKRDDIIMNCPNDASAAIITFNKVGMDAGALKVAMEEKGVAIQVASVVHTRLDLEERGIDTTARVSPHYFHDHDDMQQFFNALNDI